MTTSTNSTITLWKQDDHPAKKAFIDDDAERKRSMLNRPRLCHDFLPIGPDSNFYLPNRKKGRAISALDGVWMIGGEVEAFLPFDDSLQKVLMRELKTKFDLNRLRYVGINRYFMNGKAQNGFAHDAVCFVYALPLTWDELKAVKLDPDEYESDSWEMYNIDKILNIKDDMVRDIFNVMWSKTRDIRLAHMREFARR